MRSLRLVSFVAATIASSLASADVTVSYYNGAGDYHWKVTGMVDFDQRRDNCCGHPGLPGDGSMYCVPTSTMNLFAYAANHGFPGFDPGPANWQSQANYDLATSRIAELGALMNCDASDGTSVSGWIDGSSAWIAAYGPPPGWAVQYFYTSSDYTVRAFKMAKIAAQGSILSWCYGRYHVVTEIDGHPFVSRDGGHCVTLTEAFNDGNQAFFRYRDPADAANDAVQSTFVSKEVSLTPVTYATLPLSGFTNTMTAIAYPSSDGLIRFIDSFMALRPAFGLAYATVGDNTVIKKILPIAFGPSGPATLTLNGPLAGIADIFHDADGDDAIVLEKVAAGAPITALKRIDLLTGEETAIGSFNSLKRFTVGRTGRIYAHDGSKIYCLKADGTLESAVSNVGSPTAMAYDDANDDLLILSVPQRKVTRLDKNLQVVSSFIIPTNVAMSGDGSVFVNPFDGAVYFDTDASNAIHRLSGLSAPFTLTSLTIPGIVNPKGIAAGDDGALFISTGGVMKVARLTRSGGWAIDTSSPFNGTPASDRISMLRSRTNFDPAEHGGPAWSNILAENLLDIGVTVPDCLTDLDGDNVTGAADLARLLGAWGTSDQNSDVNGDGIVDANDLAQVLGAWGPCP